MSTQASEGSQENTGEVQRLSNRELSWIQFNSRVLAQAEDQSEPLLGRLQFASIHASNFDEFYMVRVAGLKDLAASGLDQFSPDGLSPLEQLEGIHYQVTRQLERRSDLLTTDLLPALAESGIGITSWSELSDGEKRVAATVFEERIFPVLTPLAVDPSHPFPYISNLSLNLAVLLGLGYSGENWFARVKVPPGMPRFIEVDDLRFVPLEDVISNHLELLFPGLSVVGGWPFRVTRNSDISLDDEDEDADDLLEVVELELRRRRFGRAVRLEISDGAPPEVCELLRAELQLDQRDVLASSGLLDLTAFDELVKLTRPDLKPTPSIRVPPLRLRDVETPAEMFARIADGDIFLHHPYESFNASVTRFVRHASQDAAVQAIKVTLYRTSGDSPIVNALISAAEAGKQVVVLVELTARFDESANIRWAKRLEEAGAHVVYGLVGLKTHSKVTLVIRNEADGLRRYCHIGTGNYNPRTARIYEDVGVLTANPEIGADLSELFNFLTGYGIQAEYQRLVVAPAELRGQLMSLIDQEIEAGENGHLIFKMNSLVDPGFVEKFYEASAAGVRVELIVRGICCLRPGVPGMSENISVRSIIGRYLEHSRIYYFKNGDGPGSESVFFGSADLMPRNLDRRVEALLRVEEAESARRLKEILDTNLADTALAWELDQHGEYSPLRGSYNSQSRFVELASERLV